MKKNAKVLISLLLCVSLAAPSQALAAREKKEKKPVIVKAVSPPQGELPLPEALEPAPVVNSFPELPPSNLCGPNNMLGLFRLISVYEDPAGAETNAFYAAPNQYLRFYKNKTFARINMPQADMEIKTIERAIKGHTGSLLQYVVQENGFVYFYQDSVANDVQACFMVARDKIPFRTGQLLLMPPKGQIQGRLVKVYENVAFASNAMNPPAEPQQEKPKPKRKWARKKKQNQNQSF